MCLLPVCLSANPTGGAVVAGSATIAGQGTSAVTINQASNIAIINWQSFSINSGQSTSFLQPGASSAVLNRVLGGGTSLINGTLSANGQVYLINGNGVIVGPGGVINASAFTASTRDISNADFLSGNLHFTGSSAAGVQNLGTINALGGNVALIGRTVDNEGTITAPNGTAGLIAGDDVLLAQDNADGSTITVSPAAIAPSTSAPVGVKNGGTIAAAAAELKAANGNIYGLAVQNLGTIRATTISHQGGHIWLTSDSGKVSNAGKLDASATVAGGKGGAIVVKSTSGTASHTGQIVAKGGNGGVGGQAEISGATVQFTGTVDLSAPNGTRGNLLLDPTDIDIVTGGGPGITGSTIDPVDLVAALNGANVTLTGTNTITVDNTVDSAGNASAGNLLLDTPMLNLNAPIVLNGTLSGTASTVNVSPTGSIQNGVDSVGATGGTVKLTFNVYTISNEVVINHNVNFQGNGAQLEGQGLTRILEIDGGTVGLSGMTFEGGNGQSTLGAGTSFNFSGGAILVFGQGTSAAVTISDCAFVANNANSGGAIFNLNISSGSDTIAIDSSTFTENSAIIGSALYNYGSLGGTATMTLTQDTIVGNSGSGAIYNTLLSSGTASVSIGSTILAGNMNGGSESDYQDGGGGTLVDLDHNLYGQNGNAGGFVPTGSSDILLGAGVETAVAPQSFYGGTTPIMPLVEGSPALATGDPIYAGTADQRGVVRASGTDFTDGSVDIGAVAAQFVEAQADPVSVVYGAPPLFTFSITGGPAGALGTVSGVPALLSPATNVGFYGEDIGQGTVVSSSPLYLVDFTNGDLTITQRPVTVDPDPGQGKTYGTTDPLLTYSTDAADATSGLVNGDSLSGSAGYGSEGPFTNVGSYPTTLGTIVDLSGNYMVTLTSTPPLFTISPRPVAIDVDAGQSKIYGTIDPTLTYTPEPADAFSGLVNGDTLSGAADYVGSGQFSNVGAYPTTPGTLANPNYLVFPGAPSSFVITQRPVVIDPDAGQGKTYGTPDPALTYTPEAADATSGLVNGDTLVGAPSYTGAGPFANAGTYVTTLGNVADLTGNYAVALEATPPTFSIAPRPVTVDPDPGQGKTYGSADPLLTYTTDPADSTSGLVNGDTLTGSAGYSGSGQFTPVGSYPTNLGTVADSTGNYIVSLTSTPAPFTVGLRPVFIDVDPASKTYGSNDPTLSYTPEPADATSGLLNGDTLTGAADYLGSGQFTNVGSYPTTPGTLFNPNYVTVPGAPSAFSITPALAVVLPNSGQTKIYGTPDPVLTYTTTGLFNGDTLTGAADYLGSGQFANAGTYATTTGTLANSNYIVSISAAAPTFAVTPRSVTVLPDSGQGKIYGSPDPVLTYTTSVADATTGLVNGDSLSGSPDYTGRGPKNNVGIYGITLGTLASGNYSVSLGSATNFAITPTILYYAADPFSVPSDTTPFPTFTGNVLGFVTGDTQANSTSGTLVFNTPISPGAPTGYYPIDGSGLVAANYTFNQLAVNSVALTVGMPVAPVTPVMQAAMPNNPVSQSAAQTTASTSTQDPGQSMPGGTNTPLVTSAPPATVDINVTSISPGESIDSSSGAPGSPDQTGQLGSDTGIGSDPVAQGSSFSPDIGAEPVHGGESVTVGGHPGGPAPPAVVTAQLNTVLGDQALGTLTGALADAGSAPDTGTATAATGSTPGSTTDQSSSPAAAGPAGATAPTAGALGPPGTPLPPDGVMVAPGQTVALANGHAAAIPAPAAIQNQIATGFNQETQNTLSAAAGISH